MEIREFRQSDISGICRLIGNELGYDVSVSELDFRIGQMMKEKHYQMEQFLITHFILQMKKR